MEEEIVKQVILGFPSFAGLMLMLYWQQKQISRLFERYDTLLEKLQECQDRLSAQEETD